MNPIRKPTFAGTTEVYQFEVIGTQYLVKNMSGGDVVVSFEPMEEAEETWLIPDGAWQIVPGAPNRIYRQTLYVKADAASTRGVEIEAVEYELPRRMT